MPRRRRRLMVLGPIMSSSSPPVPLSLFSFCADGGGGTQRVSVRTRAALLWSVLSIRRSRRLVRSCSICNWSMILSWPKVYCWYWLLAFGKRQFKDDSFKVVGRKLNWNRRKWELKRMEQYFFCELSQQYLFHVRIQSSWLAIEIGEWRDKIFRQKRLWRKRRYEKKFLESFGLCHKTRPNSHITRGVQK